MVLCNKQDVTDQPVLKPEGITFIAFIISILFAILRCAVAIMIEIGEILDISRLFHENPSVVIGTSFSDDHALNTDQIASYLLKHKIVSAPSDDDKKGKEDQPMRKKKMSFSRMFSSKGSSAKKEVVMVLGLEKVGKTKLLDAFAFGKRSTTSMALFEAEMLKGDHLEMYDWNYEQRSWPMAKSFLANCALVMFVVDGTAPTALRSDKKNVWTVELYLKKLLSIGHHDESYRGKGAVDDGDEKKEAEQFAEDWPLMDTPFLIYLNKCDSEQCSVTAQDLEDELCLSRMMKYRRTVHRVQECSAKTGKGVYDGLIWCRMNGLLSGISEIEQYAEKHEIKLPAKDPLGSGKIKPTKKLTM